MDVMAQYEGGRTDINIIADVMEDKWHKNAPEGLGYFRQTRLSLENGAANFFY